VTGVTRATAPISSGPISAARRLTTLLVMIVPAALWFAPLPLDPKAHHAVAIAAFMILGWITEALPHGVTGLIGCYLFWALGVARFDVAFSGFANDSPWFWLAAVAFGIMAANSGLARRLAYSVMLRIGTTPSRVLLAVIVTDFLLTVLIPAGVARVVILGAVALGMMEAMGLAPGSNIGRGVFLILTYTAGVFDKSIIAGAAAITGRAIIESQGHVAVLWSRWFLAYAPADIVTILVAWRITLWLFPPEQVPLAGGVRFLRAELQKMGAWTVIEKRTLALILLAVALWITDFLHHIPPSMVCIGITLLAAIPAVGLLDLRDLGRKNYLFLFSFVASAVSMGEVLKATKTLDILTNHLFLWVGPLLTRPYLSSFALYWAGFISHILLGSEVSMMATSLPVLMNFAHSHHLNALALGMIWTFSSGGKIFMYQSSVLIVGYSYGYFGPKDLFRLGLCMSIVDSLQLLLLVPLYWPLVGIGPLVIGN